MNKDHYSMSGDINALHFDRYKNSTEVVSGLIVEETLKACLAGRLNVLLVGETGEGKTQIENDILALFGNNGFFEQGRNDLTVRDMFTCLNLEKLRTGRTSEEVKELTAKIDHPVYVVDEITRCIPAVQNQFFNLFDGFITVDGVKYNLGRNNYSIGIASGNVGNGKYVGTSEMDRALRDRMHLILDLDYFPTTATDTLDILVGKADPRVSSSAGENHTERIIRAYEALKEESPTIQQYVALLYLVHGLDYLDGVEGNSKRINKNAWPGCVQNHDAGSDAALIFPFSKRSTITTKTLAKALEAVKEAKSDPYTDSTDAVFDAAYLVGAQSGVLHPAAVDSNYDGNPYRAMNAVIDGIKTEFEAKKDVLFAALKYAQKGEVKHLDEFTGRWAYMKDVLESTARAVQEEKQ